jgi:hypothetical protein
MIDLQQNKLEYLSLAGMITLGYFCFTLLYIKLEYFAPGMLY